jgi:hypothetical protein
MKTEKKNAVPEALRDGKIALCGSCAGIRKVSDEEDGAFSKKLGKMRAATRYTDLAE